MTALPAYQRDIKKHRAKFEAWVSERGGEVLTPMMTGRKRRQYATVRLSTSPRIDRKVHILVLEAFIGPRPPGQLGCHKNDDASNNSLANLEWGSPKRNAQTCAELSDRVDRSRVLDMRACGVKNRSIAGWFGISEQRACDLAHGR